MILAVMLDRDEDALVCDMAETYHVLDMYSLPAEKAAVLAAGLRDSSRIKMALSGSRIGLDSMLLAAAVDRLGFIAWGMSKDGKAGRNRPASVVEAVSGGKDNKKTVAFETPEDFDAAWTAITKGNRKDGN